MANYDVDINIALQGSDKLRALSTAVRKVTKDIGTLNAKTIKIGKELDKTFKKAHIQNADNYSKAVKRAERALRKAAAGTREEREAISMVVRARKEANAELERQNALLRQEERLQGVKKAVRASDRVSVISPHSSPVFGARHIEGSPMARDFGFEPKKKRGGGSTKPQVMTAGKRFGAAVSAGAFPLLFGGGPFMSGLGAIGGAMSGSTFGPTAIALQVFGAAVDEFVANAAKLGQALNPLTADVDAIIKAAGGLNSETSLLVKELEAAGYSTAALEIATKSLTVQIGEKGVAALKEFGDDTVQLGNEFSRAMTMMAGAVANVVNAVGVLKVAAFVLEKTVLRQQINALIDTDTPEGKRLRESTTEVFSGAAGGSTSQRFFTGKTFEIMRQINKDAQDELDKTAAMRLSKKEINKIEKMELELRKQNLSFESEEFRLAKEKIINIKYGMQLEKARTKFANSTKTETLAYEDLVADKEKIRIDKANELLDLDAKLNSAKERAAKRAESAGEKALRESKRLSNERARQVEQTLTLEKQFSLEIANRQAVSQLEVDKNNINAEYAKRMERIKKIGDDILTADAEKFAGQIKTLKLAEAEANARERSLRAANALKDSQAGFELQLETLKANAPGQFAGVFGGSERTQFLEELKMQQELAKFDRDIGAAKPEDRGDLEKERDQYKLYQEQIIEATVAQQQFKEALALTQPVTDSLFDSLMAVADGTKTAQESFADFLRSIASMLVDVSKRMIATYIAIGVARLFAGVPGAEESAAPASKYGAAANLAGPTGDFGLGSGPMFPFPTRALGGAVGAGQPYLVGERGPELFVPGAQGNIVPNNAMGGANVTVNVDASGSSVQGDSQSSSQLGKAIGAAVQAELIKQKRPGGLLTR